MERSKGSTVSGDELERRLMRMREGARSQYVKELVNFIESRDPSEACAELNALSRMLDEIAIIYLVHTDTESGRCCAKALKDYLESNHAKTVRTIEVEGLSGAETFQAGLSNLARTIAELVVRHRGRGRVRICATGGFKPETVIASVIGFIAGAPVYYIHEAFREEVHLPALPLTWRIKPEHRKAIEALLQAGEQGIDKLEFQREFGYQTVKMLQENWLIEEIENRYRPTKIMKAIMEAIQMLK